MYAEALPAHTEGGYVEIHDATFSTNTVSTGSGGGLYNGGLMNLQGVTIKDNSNGVFAFTGIRMSDTVLQNPGWLNCDGTGILPSSAGGNFSTDNSCGLSGNGDRQGVGLDPQLDPLTRDASGITSYHMPRPGSPLINAAVPPCSPRDQRNGARLDACDIGAVEYRSLLRVGFLPLVVH